MKYNQRSCGCVTCPVCGEDWEHPDYATRIRLRIPGWCMKDMTPGERAIVEKGREAAWAEHLKKHGWLPGPRLLISNALYWLAGRFRP